MRLISKKTLLLFFVPGALFMFVFLVYPIFIMAYDSLFKFDFFGNRTYVGVLNYVRAFTESDFLVPLKNTLFYVGFAVSIELIIGVVFALVLEHDFRGAKIIRSVILSPLMIAPLIAGLTWRLMFNANFGIINQILKNIGIIGNDHLNTILWLADEKLALFATSIADIWLTVPFIMLMSLAALQGVDSSLLEAAKIDGANLFQVIFKIKLPIIKPILLTALSIRLIDAARTFDIVWIMAEDKIDILGTVIYKTLVKYNHPGYASAMAMIFIVVLVVFSLMLLQHLWRPSKKL